MFLYPHLLLSFCILFFCFFFFFQAEDGIRDADVTGVQTCALPIWPEAPEEREGCFVEGDHACRAAGAPAYRTLDSLSRGVAEGAAGVLTDAARLRSEERRVGKECRSRWWP